MRLLLDTHIFLWFIMGDPRLSRTAFEYVEEIRYKKWISMASLWEIAVKVSVGKLDLPRPFNVYLPEKLTRNGIALLPVTFEHTEELSRLTLHHRDPFDRMIVAQAIVEKMPIVSQDAAFDLYKVKRLW